MLGDRIRARLAALEISESELARRVGIRQSSVNALVRGETRSSRHLHEIARELRTTTGYLRGESDDPEEGYTAPASPSVQLVSMQVALPSEAALSRMFEGLLLPLDLTRPKAELAQMLARRLPTGLAQLQDLLPLPAQATAIAPGEDALSRAKDHPERPQAPRT